MSVSYGMKRSKFFLAVTKIFDRAFSDKYLLITNLGLSVSLSAVGDVIEQKYEITTRKIDQWDKIRTRNMSITGLTVGFFCHAWYRYLDKFLPGYSLRVVMKKVAVDQFIASPICITTFFLTLAILENSSKKEFVKEMKEKAWKLYAADWTIWPPAQFINFYLLPPKYRVLFDNGISLCFDVFTSYVRYDEPKDTEDT